MQNRRHTDALESFDRDRYAALLDRIAWSQVDQANSDIAWSMKSANSDAPFRHLYA